MNQPAKAIFTTSLPEQLIIKLRNAARRRGVHIRELVEAAIRKEIETKEPSK